MTQKQIEYDHYPEKFPEGKSTKRVELLGLKEHLSDSHERRNFLGSLSDQEMQKMVGYLNAITRNEHLTGAYNYEEGQLPLAATPSKEDKSELMQRTYEAAREILNNDDYTDEEALERAGLTFAGAINIIHPYNNGNGRTGRLMHYLTTYGTERQPEFDNEVYAIVAKTPVYDTDPNEALYDTPPPELTSAIDASIRSSEISEEELASRRSLKFLDVMTEKTHLPVTRKVIRSYRNSSGEKHREVIEPNTIGGYELFLKDYKEKSAIAQRGPHDVPASAHRIIAEKPDTEPSMHHIDLDIVS